MARFNALLFTGLLVILAGCAGMPRQPTLATVISRNTDAMGGLEASKRVRSIRYYLTITEPKFQVQGVYTADRRGRARIDIFHQGRRVFSEAFDGEKAWQMTADGKATPSSASGAANLRDGAEFPGKLLTLGELNSVGARLSLLPDETIEGSEYHVLRLVRRDDTSVLLYVNPDTWLIDWQREDAALHPDLDATQKSMQTHMMGYRQVGAVIRSYDSVQRDLRDGRVVQKTSASKIIFNVPVDDSIFVAGSPPPAQPL